MKYYFYNHSINEEQRKTNTWKISKIWKVLKQDKIEQFKFEKKC